MGDCDLICFQKIRKIVDCSEEESEQGVETVDQTSSEPSDQELHDEAEGESKVEDEPPGPRSVSLADEYDEEFEENGESEISEPEYVECGLASDSGF